jgi:hypothetical protein
MPSVASFLEQRLLEHPKRFGNTLEEIAQSPPSMYNNNGSVALLWDRDVAVPLAISNFEFHTAAA